MRSSLLAGAAEKEEEEEEDEYSVYDVSSQGSAGGMIGVCGSGFWEKPVGNRFLFNGSIRQAACSLVAEVTEVGVGTTSASVPLLFRSRKASNSSVSLRSLGDFAWSIAERVGAPRSTIFAPSRTWLGGGEVEVASE